MGKEFLCDDIDELFSVSDVESCPFSGDYKEIVEKDNERSTSNGNLYIERFASEVDVKPCAAIMRVRSDSSVVVDVIQSRRDTVPYEFFYSERYDLYRDSVIYNDSHAFGNLDKSVDMKHCRYLLNERATDFLVESYMKARNVVNPCYNHVISEIYMFGLHAKYPKYKSDDIICKIEKGEEVSSGDYILCYVSVGNVIIHKILNIAAHSNGISVMSMNNFDSVYVWMNGERLYLQHGNFSPFLIGCEEPCKSVTSMYYKVKKEMFDNVFAAACEFMEYMQDVRSKFVHAAVCYESSVGGVVWTE